MDIEQITDYIFRVRGSVWAGLIVRDGKALFIDAPETVFSDELSDAARQCGAQHIDGVLITQHRRAFSGGLLQLEPSMPKVYASAGEAGLLSKADKFWRSTTDRYYRFYDTVPDRFMPLKSIQAHQILEDGEVLDWNGISVTAIQFSALSIADMCYIVDDGISRVAFCGGLMMRDGKLHDLYSFQQAMGGISGYHGHLGGFIPLKKGLECLYAMNPDLLAPAWGGIDPHPMQSIASLEKRISVYGAEYARYSALRYYYPDHFASRFESYMDAITPPESAPVSDLPVWIKRLEETTSFIVLSRSGKALLIDTMNPSIAERISKINETSDPFKLDLCWISHYHFDHIDGLAALASQYDCDIISSPSVAEVANQPTAYFLPCTSNIAAKIRIVKDEQSIQWEEFTLHCLHFPGQTLYHSSLLVEGNDTAVIFCGDSFTPTGFDDYCSDNRNLPGLNRGYLYCLELLEKLKPDILINSHQSEPFIYNASHIDRLKEQLFLREKLLSELLPSNIGLGLDSLWLRAWPFEQTAASGSRITLSIHVTSHCTQRIKVYPQLPDGWSADPQVQEMETAIPSSGSAFWHTADTPPDTALQFYIDIPWEADGAYHIPFDCFVDDHYIGSFAHAQINVLPCRPAMVCNN